jgi:hypothetical protein
VVFLEEIIPDERNSIPTLPVQGLDPNAEFTRIIFGRSHYEGGKKYCRRCEVYIYHDGMFCPCCGMALRGSLPPHLLPFVLSLLLFVSLVDVKI